MYEETTEKLLEFISSSPTAFHAAETIRKRFLEEGFTELKEEEHWELEKGGKYFVMRNHSAIIGFSIPMNDSAEFIKKNEEIMTNSLLYDLVNQMYLNTDMQDEAPKDKIFEAESQVVRDLAKKGNCVIVGRCADYVLRNSANCLKVFFSAPLESRIKRVAQRQNISEKEARAVVQKNEKLRADNYRYYTRRMWGAAGNFDLSLNTDLGEAYIESCIRSAMKL